MEAQKTWLAKAFTKNKNTVGGNSVPEFDFSESDSDSDKSSSFGLILEFNSADMRFRFYF